MSPSYGPKDGGTLITLTGSQLNAGLTQNVLVNNLNCTIIGSVTHTPPLINEYDDDHDDRHSPLFHTPRVFWCLNYCANSRNVQKVNAVHRSCYQNLANGKFN